MPDEQVRTSPKKAITLDVSGNTRQSLYTFLAAWFFGTVIFLFGNVCDIGPLKTFGGLLLFASFLPVVIRIHILGCFFWPVISLLVIASAGMVPFAAMMLDLMATVLIAGGCVALAWVSLTVSGRSFLLDYLGQIETIERNWDKAEALLRKSLALREATYGGHHAKTAQTLTFLAQLAALREQWDQFNALADKALAIQEHLLPPSHPLLLGCWNNKALCFQHFGQWGRASSVFRSLVEQVPAKDRNRELEKVTYLLNWSNCLIDLGEYAKADVLLCRVRTIIGRNEGIVIHPSLRATVASIQAMLRLRENRLEDAYELAKEARKWLEDCSGNRPKGYLTTCMVEARVVFAMGRIAKAKKLAEGHYHSTRHQYGEETTLLIDPLLLMAQCAVNEGSFEEAAALFTRCETLVRSQTPGHPVLADILDTSGVSLLRQGKLDEAEGLLQSALDHRRGTLPAFHPDIVASLEHLANLRHQQQRPEDAKALETEVGLLRQMHQQQQLTDAKSFSI